MRDVENGLVDEILRGQTRRRKEKLLVRVLLAIDAGEYRRTSVVETYVRVEAECERSENVRAFVSEKADAKSDGDSSPVVIGCAARVA